MKKYIVNGWTYDRDEKSIADTYPLIAKEFDTLREAQEYHREIVKMHKDGRFIQILGDDVYYVCIDVNYLYTLDEKTVEL